MTYRPFVFQLALMTIVLADSGCSRLEPSTRVQQTRTQFEQIARQSADGEEKPAEPDIASSETNRVESEATLDEDFKPPYPERVDPFQQPNVRDLAETEREAVEDTSAVELKGFLNVDGLRAIVAIEGRVLAMAAGEQREGIRVVEVSPPQIILQRGRVRWTEALYAVP